MKKELETIFVDFNNADKNKRLRLNNKGSQDDIMKQKIELKVGKEILVKDSDGLSCLGILQYSEEEKLWVAFINWDNISMES